MELWMELESNFLIFDHSMAIYIYVYNDGRCVYYSMKSAESKAVNITL